jgi:hypothetical protein
MASLHLSNALKDLIAERDDLSVRMKKLAQRMQVIESGIESLSSLLSDDASERILGSPVISDKPFKLNPDLPLWHIIGLALLSRGPMQVKDIAQFLLEEGYQTRSGDFANVVGTNLRSSEHFKKLEDGRWALVNPAGFTSLEG